MDKQKFLDKISAGEILVADGATGTNLQARGLPNGVSTEMWLFDQPEKCMDLQRDFIKAGSDIILTNTFGGTAAKLNKIGWGSRAVEVNKRAVELARQTVGDSLVYVAGSIGPTGELIKPLGSLEEDEAERQFADQARALAEAGVDFLVIETQFDITEATAAVRGAHSVCSLPVVCSFSYDRGTRTMMGVNPQKMAQAISALGVDVLGINCGRSLEDNLKALVELKSSTDLPIWFKPNAGMPKLDAQGNSVYDVSPDEMGALIPVWISAGARIVGGCCGTSPEHLKAIALAVKNIK